MWQKWANNSREWLNSARVARCQRAQKPGIKNPKTSYRAEYWYLPTTRFSSSSVALKHNFLSKNSELVLPPYEATEILLWALRAQINLSDKNPGKGSRLQNACRNWNSLYDMVAAGETMVRRSKRISHGMNEKVKKAATFSKISLPSMSGHFAFKTGASFAPNTPWSKHKNQNIRRKFWLETNAVNLDNSTLENGSKAILPLDLVFSFIYPWGYPKHFL